jgi:hypothetical protein
VSQQTRARSPFLDGQFRRRRLEHHLAAATRIFGPDMTDDLQPGRDLFQHLGCRLADLGQAARVTVAAMTDDLRLMHHHFPWQVRRQRLATSGFPTWVGLLVIGSVEAGIGSVLLPDILLEILQAQFQLHDFAVELLRGMPVTLPP